MLYSPTGLIKTESLVLNDHSQAVENKSKKVTFPANFEGTSKIL